MAAVRETDARPRDDDGGWLSPAVRRPQRRSQACGSSLELAGFRLGSMRLDEAVTRLLGFPANRIALATSAVG